MDKIIFHIDVNSAYLSWSALEELSKGGPPAPSRFSHPSPVFLCLPVC